MNICNTDVNNVSKEKKYETPKPAGLHDLLEISHENRHVESSKLVAQVKRLQSGKQNTYITTTVFQLALFFFFFTFVKRITRY